MQFNDIAGNTQEAESEVRQMHEAAQALVPQKREQPKAATPQPAAIPPPVPQSKAAQQKRSPSPQVTPCLCLHMWNRVCV